MCQNHLFFYFTLFSSANVKCNSQLLGEQGPARNINKYHDVIETTIMGNLSFRGSYPDGNVCREFDMILARSRYQKQNRYLNSPEIDDDKWTFVSSLSSRDRREIINAKVQITIKRWLYANARTTAYLSPLLSLVLCRTLPFRFSRSSAILRFLRSEERVLVTISNDHSSRPSKKATGHGEPSEHGRNWSLD